MRLNKSLQIFEYTDAEYKEIITKLPHSRHYQMKKMLKEVPDEHLSNILVQKWSKADTDLVF